MEKDGTHFCRCNLGWQGEACNACVPYWECPYKGDGACEKPNECRCPTGTRDPDDLCESFFTPVTDEPTTEWVMSSSPSPEEMIIGRMVISKESSLTTSNPEEGI